MENNDTSFDNVRSSKKGKRAFKLLVIVLLILLPSLTAAIAFFVISESYGFSSDSMYEISLYNEKGEIIAEDRAYPDNAKEGSIVAIFAPITTNFLKTTILPDAIDKTNYLSAVVEYMDITDEYVFFFSTTDNVGYCTVNKKKTYLVDADSTHKILSAEFAETFYDTADPPKLYTSSGEEILPKSVSWRYMSVSGEYFKSDSYEITSKDLAYILPGGLEFSFGTAPDSCSVIISQDGSEIFSGDYSEMSTVSFDKDRSVSIEVEAEWAEKNDAECYGKIRYSFDATVTEKADFRLNGETFEVGEVCLISATNIDDVSKIRFRSVPDIDVELIFGRNGYGAVAFLPITSEMEAQSYELTFSYGAASETFLINVSEDIRDGVVVPCLVSVKQYVDCIGEESTSEIEALKVFAAENSTGNKLYTGQFLSYTELGGAVHAKLGDVYRISSSYYEAWGNEYRFADHSGVGVRALNNGQVIKTGYNKYLGNYVIVSHGCGLVTWYAHLGITDVAEGQYVAKGETLGKTGTSGLSDGENVLVIVTVGSTVVDPTYILGNTYE